MCGIAGFSGINDRLLLEAMTDTLIHRGPDDEGFYYDEHVSLGMRRLSIIDVQGGQARRRHQHRRGHRGSAARRYSASSSPRKTRCSG